MAPSPSKPFDLTFRGTKKPSQAGMRTFVALRPLGTLLQVALLHQPAGWGTRLLSFVGLASIPVSTTSSLPLPHLLLTAFSAASAAKNVWWLIDIAYEYFPPSMAFFVSGYNATLDTVSSLLYLCAATSSSSPVTLGGINFNPLLPGGLSLAMIAGTALVSLGLTMEAVSEQERRLFKDNPANQGTLCRTGMWARCRHPNYGGYALWRTGYAMAAGGLVAGIMVGGIQTADFAMRAVPALEMYCRKHYDEQWERYQRDVPYILFPGIF